MMFQFIPFPVILSMITLIGFVVILYYRKYNIYYLFFFALFWIYFFLVVSLTLFPMPIRSSPVAQFPLQSAAVILSRVNWVPFDYSQFKRLDPATIIIREVVANIVLTMPFGFLINFITPSKIRKIPLLSLAVGTGIEFTQLLMCLMVGMNYCGIDNNDALMNAAGVICGYGCFCLFLRLFTRFTTRHHETKGIFAFINMIAMRFYPTKLRDPE